jgi:zinc transport system substrate-binding protein
MLEPASSFRTARSFVHEGSRMSHLRYVIAVLSPVVVLLAGCVPSGTPESPDALSVTVSILPQKFFLERIGGEYVRVNVMVLPGESPATYEPRPAQLKALTKADAYVSIGVPFERAWLERIASANSGMLMVDTTEGIDRICSGGSCDPHIWLSPRLVKIQARTIYEGLVTLDPTHEEEYGANLDGFIAEIDELDAHIRQKLVGVEQRKFMVFHPSWGYFARDYGLEMIPVQIEGQEPSAAELAELVVRAKRENIQVIFAQPEFSTRAAETIADEIGGKVLLISPLAENWLENMRSVAETFGQVLSSWPWSGGRFVVHGAPGGTGVPGARLGRGQGQAPLQGADEWA